MPNSASISGLTETLAGLQQFRKATAKSVLARALKAAAKPIADAATAAAPSRRGNLKRSIKITTVRSSSGGAAYASAKTSGASDDDAAAAARVANSGSGLAAKVRVSATAPYAAHVELGTRLAPAEPFLGPAFRHNREAAVRSLTDNLKQQIQATANRIAKRKASKP